MRRPSPLPAPAARPAAPAPPVEDEEPRPAEVLRGEEEHPTAPVIPLAAPEEEDVATEVDDEPVRVREVWAAARARRRALRAEVRRFTGRQRRRRIVWLASIGAFLVMVAATVGVAYSPLFAVERVTIVGTTSLDTAAVEQALQDQIGTPLALVDESEVKAALVGFPLVETYSLEARPPHELVVRIVERTPVGYIEGRAGFSLVDAAGVVLSTSPAAGSDAPLLTIEGGAQSAAFTAAGQVMRSLPDGIRMQVTAVSASSPDDVRLTLGGANATVVWGSAEDSAMKAVVLEKAMINRPPASVSEYDVSSPAAVVVR